MKYHIIALLTGFILDLLCGDPHWLPHPIRLIGHLIDRLRKILLRQTDTGAVKRRNGAVLVVLVCLLTELVAAVVLLGAYRLHPYLGCFIEAVMTYQLLALKCLRVESEKVYTALMHGTIEEARYAVSMIVGRDTKTLDEAGVTRAAVETVAENASDGVIAPMLYLAAGGPLAGFFYKAVNTMDSMIGYKNDRYLDFGRYAAKLDDVLNYLPSRISAWLMILSCSLLGKHYNAKEAKRIYLRDRRKHASPNSAQTEAACAGALGLRLAGPSCYFGKLVEKPYIGDPGKKIEPEDIRRANKLLYQTAFSCLICIMLVWAVINLIH